MQRRVAGQTHVYARSLLHPRPLIGCLLSPNTKTMGHSATRLVSRIWHHLASIPCLRPLTTLVMAISRATPDLRVITPREMRDPAPLKACRFSRGPRRCDCSVHLPHLAFQAALAHARVTALHVRFCPNESTYSPCTLISQRRRSASHQKSTPPTARGREPE